MKAIVTGHSRGLGAALVRALAARGIPVLGLARSHAEGMGALVHQVKLDLSDSAALAAWLTGPQLNAFCDDQETLLINNAGMVQPVGPAHSQDLAGIGAAVALNVTAPLMLAAAVARLAGRKRIVHISSGAARAPYAGWAIYCATKAALDHHARAAALDETPGLRICSLAPGIIDTAMQAAIRATPDALFPARDKFVALHRDGELRDPARCAAELLDYVFSEHFGAHPVEDLRHLTQV